MGVYSREIVNLTVVTVSNRWLGYWSGYTCAQRKTRKLYIYSTVRLYGTSKRRKNRLLVFYFVMKKKIYCTDL